VLHPAFSALRFSCARATSHWRFLHYASVVPEPRRIGRPVVRTALAGNGGTTVILVYPLATGPSPRT
jgi:hypothetical protein